MKKILLVDDEAEQLEILKTSLECREIRAVILTASSGSEALAIIKKGGVDLLLTDVHMPQMSGMDLILESAKVAPDLAFIVITAFPTAEIKRDALLKGCLRFVEKPYDIEELRATVSNALADMKGFTGTMAGIDLADMIQLHCLSCNTAAIKVKNGRQSGMIFFDGGNIVHALIDEIEGEEAFYRIMSFTGGSLESKKNVTAPARTIDKSHVALLLEAIRRQDERGNKAEADAGEPPPQHAAFRELAKISGYMGAAIIKNKGGVVAVDTTDKKIDLNTGTTVIAELFKMATETVARSGLGKCAATVIEAEEGTVVTHRAGNKDELLLVTLIAPDSNPTLLQMKMAHLAPEIRARS